MSLADLASTIVNVKYLVENEKAALAKKPDAKAMLDLCSNYRRLACAHLLIELDVEEFANNLFFSGVVYLKLLRMRETPGIDPYYLTSSMGGPLVDAIAAGAESLAVKIAQDMPRTVAKTQGELVEDFHYFQLLMALSSPTPTDSALTAHLASFEQSLQGGFSPRFDVVSALVTRDATAFEQHLDAFLRMWRLDLEQRRKANRIQAYDATTTAHVCVEGLALVRLAKRRGLSVAPEYPGIPDAVIALAPESFPDESDALQ